MTRLLAWGVDRPRRVLLVTALVTLGFLAQFPRAVIDTDPENMLAADQTDRAFYAQVKADFGIYDLIVAGVRDPDGIFRVDTLRLLARIADGIVAIDGVEPLETLLLVEDEPAIKDIMARRLERKGYTVLTAHNGMQAQDVVERHRGRIDLLVTDVVMPHMDGFTLERRLTALFPSLKVSQAHS